METIHRFQFHRLPDEISAVMPVAYSFLRLFQNFDSDSQLSQNDTELCQDELGVQASAYTM